MEGRPILTNRRIAPLFLLAVLLAAALSNVAAEPAYRPFSVEVDGEVLSYRHNDYYLEGDRTYVSAEKLLAALSTEYSIDHKRKIVTAKKGEVSLILPIGEAYAEINGKRITRKNQVRTVNATLLLPVRFVSETFGCTVHWYPDTRTVIVDVKPKQYGVIDGSLLASAAQGTISGIAVKLGDSRQQVEHTCGGPSDAFSYEGGTFFEYPPCRCAIFYDDQELAAVVWVYHAATGNLRTADAKQILGEPEWEEQNQTHSGYLLNYPAGPNQITLRASSKHGTITGLWLSAKQQ
ncbi:MAG: copper amine oxidase N-terminal domain-containing protein [Brevibacillus sp.]|nr:copper amine oxidase N-terminal domain-containing protein [Brevibacillus sp.]